jgi:hypothetical protein
MAEGGPGGACGRCEAKLRNHLFVRVVLRALAVMSGSVFTQNRTSHDRISQGLGETSDLPNPAGRLDARVRSGGLPASLPIAACGCWTRAAPQTEAHMQQTLLVTADQGCRGGGPAWAYELPRQAAAARDSRRRRGVRSSRAAHPSRLGVCESRFRCLCTAGGSLAERESLKERGHSNTSTGDG